MTRPQIRTKSARWICATKAAFLLLVPGCCDGFSAASDPVAKSEAAKIAEPAAGPRLGKYRIYSYGATGNRLYLGEIELVADGNYHALQPGGKTLGEGKYRFDSAKSTVIWESGPYHSSEWG